MHRQIKIATWALACPLLVYGDGVFSTNSCSIHTGYNYVTNMPVDITTTQVDPVSCSVQGPDFAPGNAVANTHITVNLPEAGQPGNPIGAAIGETVGASVDLGELGTAEALARADYEFTTTGPVRSGFLVLGSGNISFTIGPDQVDIATADIRIGAFSEHCTGNSHNTSCSGSLGTAAGRLPFTLGQDFEYYEELHLLAASTAFEIEDGGGVLNFPFTLLEADGVTPVQVALATPEPQYQMLFGCGLLALFAFRRKRG